MLTADVRSLTKRQRDILQLYVDDLEGRTTEETPSAPTGGEAASNGDQEAKEKTADDNGTGSFTRASPSPEGGWMSRALHRIRGLIGF
jgi:molecular chaperone DnaJ